MGSGSVGSFYGGLIALKSKLVLFIGRSPHIDVINEKGLIIKGIANQVKISAVNNILDAKAFFEKNKEPIEYVLFTTKAHQTESAAKELQSLIPSSSTIISIQNGIGTEEILKNYFKKNIVLRVITSIGVNCPEPGIVELTGNGMTLVGYQNSIEKSHADRFVHLLRSSKIKAKLESNILGAVFSKTIVNCALNPLTAIYKVKNIEILRQKKLKAEAIFLASEAWEVAKKLNIKLITKNPIKLAFKIIKKTGKNVNSMLKDIQNNKKTEIEFLNGKIISLGLKLGIDVSHNQKIYQKVLTLEKSFERDQ